MGTLDDIKWGLIRGLIFGTLYCGVAGALYLLSGPELFARNGTTLATMSFVYLGGGLAAGAIIGLLRPLLKVESTAAFVAILAAMPITVGLTMIATGKLWNWSTREWFVFLVSSAFFGLAGKKVFWERMNT